MSTRRPESAELLARWLADELERASRDLDPFKRLVLGQIKHVLERRAPGRPT